MLQARQIAVNIGVLRLGEPADDAIAEFFNDAGLSGAQSFGFTELDVA
jgi:hypothetical protein